MSINKQIVETQNKIKVIDAKMRNDKNNLQLKKDKAILQEFVTFLQNKGKG